MMGRLTNNVELTEVIGGIDAVELFADPAGGPFMRGADGIGDRPSFDRELLMPPREGESEPKPSPPAPLTMPILIL